MADDSSAPPDPDWLVAHFGPEGPVPVAQEWLRLVLDQGDVAAAWPLTDPNLRLALVQNLIWANQDNLGRPWSPDIGDEMAAALSQSSPTHPDWPAMQRGLLRILRGVWEGSPPPSTWGAMRPRVVDPVHELLVFVPDIPEGQYVQPGGTVGGYPILMSSQDDGWLVAGFQEFPPTPGWPPVFPPPAGIELT